MLYTLTTNPAVDLNVTARNVSANKVNRTKDAVFTPNGKGLNVSFTLRHFGTDSGIIGFFGGFTGEYIANYCRDNGYPLLSAEVEGITRVNLFVATTENEEYKFVNEGPKVSAKTQEQLLNAINNAIDLDVLSVHGSAANGQSENFYNRLFEICNGRNIPVILDISSPKLKELLRYSPLLIKPNDDELKEVFGWEIHNEADVLVAMENLHQLGAQNVLLTMGAKGSYFSNGTDVYFCDTVKIKLKSSACAGDACLASFLSIWLNDKTDIESAMKRASAAGANVAESDGLGDFSNVSAYEKQLTVRKVVK